MVSISRVTSQTRWSTLRNDMAASSRRVSDSTGQLATGRKIRTVSDAPTDAATVLRLDEHASAIEAYFKQSTDAKGWLETTDTALMAVSNVITEALGVTKAGRNGALNPEARDALGTQLEALSDHLYDLASASHLGRPVFGGFADAAVSKDAAGVVSFVGDGGQVLRQVSPTLTVPVSVDGAAAFGFTSGDDVFTVLRDAAAAVRAGDDAGAKDALGRLQLRHTDALTALHNVGTTRNRVDSATDRGEAMKLSLASARSDLVDIDIPKAVMDMQLAQDGYNAVLGAISRVAQIPSLAELLR